MARDKGVIYLLHLDRPYKHAKHYTGNPEGSGFLKVRLAADRGKFTELPAVLAGRLSGRAGLLGEADLAVVVAVVAGDALAGDLTAGSARRPAGVAGGGA